MFLFKQNKEDQIIFGLLCLWLLYKYNFSKFISHIEYVKTCVLIQYINNRNIILRIFLPILAILLQLYHL